MGAIRYIPFFTTNQFSKTKIKDITFGGNFSNNFSQNIENPSRSSVGLSILRHFIEKIVET